MIVGVHGIGKTTLLQALRKEGQGSFKETDFKAHFNDRRRSQKSKSFFLVCTTIQVFHNFSVLM